MVSWLNLVNIYNWIITFGEVLYLSFSITDRWNEKKEQYIFTSSDTDSFLADVGEYMTLLVGFSLLSLYHLIELKKLTYFFCTLFWQRKNSVQEVTWISHLVSSSLFSASNIMTLLLYVLSCWFSSHKESYLAFCCRNSSIWQWYTCKNNSKDGHLHVILRKILIH